MQYVEKVDLHGFLPPQFVVEALDDNGDGQVDEDSWAAVQKAAVQEVDGILGQRYKTPFKHPFPSIVTHAARIFAAEQLYARRGMAGDKNPWTARADEERKKLRLIAEGKAPLGPGFDRAKPSVSVISEPSKTHSKNTNV